MRTISAIVEQQIKESPYLEEALSLGIINLSSLARRLKPKIDSVNLKRNSFGAIIMALQRLGQKLKRKNFGKSKMLAPAEFVLRSNITEFIFKLSPGFARSQQDLVNQLKNQKETYMTMARGVSEATIFVSEAEAVKVASLFRKENLVLRMDKLFCIFLRFSENTFQIPGVYYNVLKALAWEGIAINEVISVGNELSLIFEKSQIQKAFLVIENLIKPSNK